MEYQDNQGQQYEEQPNYGYSPIVQRSDKADLLDKINPDAIVEVLRHKMMGEEFINGGWVKIPELQGRALSRTGAWDISNLMLAASSQNVSLSKLNDHEIRERCLSIAKTAQLMCLRNWRDYGIKGTDQLNFVNDILMSNTLITLKQPENGGIRELLKGTTQEHRMHSTIDEKRGFSLFSRKRGN